MGDINSILGILLALLSSFLFNISPILQKDALNSMEEITTGNVKRSIRFMFSNKKWMLGMIISIPAIVFYIFAVKFVGIVVVEPLNNLTENNLQYWIF